MLKYLKYLFFLSFSFGSLAAVAAVVDNGRDANGNLIVSEVLAKRCGLSSGNPIVTNDCINRLAYDYKTGIITGYASYAEERSAIMHDYVGEYIYKAVKSLVSAGEYEDHIDDLIGENPLETVSLDNDSREKMEANNKISSDNSSMFLEAIDLRASSINLTNIGNILSVLVPQVDVNTESHDLALPPS